jgi:hypothetical protein
MRCEGQNVDRVSMANKIYLRALPEALTTSIAEVAYECNVLVEVACPESSR